MITSTLKILHGSDLQVGKPFRPRAAEAFRRLALEVEPHLIVVSGDLTQRAKQREFRAAWEFLQRLPTVPLVVTLGNHDVPLYRVWERVLLPYWHWSREIPRDRDSVAQVFSRINFFLSEAGSTIGPLTATVLAGDGAVVNGLFGCNVGDTAVFSAEFDPTDLTDVEDLELFLVISGVTGHVARVYGADVLYPVR